MPDQSSSTTDIKSEVDIKKHNVFDGFNSLMHSNKIPQTNLTNINLLNHPEISGFIGSLKKYGEGFVQFIDQQHIQTVIFDPSADNTAEINIQIISPTSNESNTDTKNTTTDTKKTEISAVKGKVAAVYDTTMKTNGDVQNLYPSKIDTTLWTRHNALVDQMWKSKTDTMTKIIDALTGALKLGSLL